MRFKEKDLEIPQVCLDLGFEDRSYSKERSARMYNPELDCTLWVYGPGGGERTQDGLPATRVTGNKNRYVLQDCGDGILGEVETDDELRKLVSRARGRVYSSVTPQ
jgi:hypothetical protein